MNAEYVGKGQDFGEWSILVRVAMTNHAWAGFGYMHVNREKEMRVDWNAILERFS